jgi:uncharacterized repeat protein (TIGR01451 family)
MGHEPMDPPTPQVTLRVRVPARVAPGEKLTYRLLVENHSQARAHHVLVRDRLSAGARFDHADPKPSENTPDLLWKLGTLEPAARKEITLVVATEGKGEVENHAYVQCEHGQTVRTQVSRPGLRLRVTAPATAQPTIQAFDLKMEVANDGQVEVKDVVLTSELPRGLTLVNAPDAVDKGNLITWKIGTLRPGQTWSKPLQVMSPEPGEYKVKSDVTATGDLHETADTTVKVGEGKLALKVTGPASARVDRPATYQVTVTNAGKVPSPDVEIVDRLYQGIIFRWASDGGQNANQEVRWRLGPLAPGASRTVSCMIQAEREGLFSNVVRVQDAIGLSDLAKTSTRFSWLTVSMERRQDAIVVGQQATLVFHLGNAPRGRPVTGVRLSVTVPDGLRVLPLQNALAGDVVGGRVAFAQVARLEPGETRAFSIKVEGVKAGKAIVKAEMITQEMERAGSSNKLFADPLVSEETVQVVEGQDPARVTFNQQ